VALGLGVVAAALVGGAGVGCASRAPASAEFGVQAPQYQRAIEVARDVLLEARFEIDRVDAAGGVITTLPKMTGGLLTPWDGEQTTMDQEVADATSAHRRRVRITFEPAAIDMPRRSAGQAAADTVAGPRAATAGLGAVGGENALVDLRSSGVPLTARVEVFVDRVRRPGVRLETESIRRSSVAVDPDLSSRRMTPEYVETVDHDDLLAGRIAERIRERLAE